MRKKIWNSFLVSFINGIVILMPVAMTIAIVRFIVLKVNSLILNPIIKFFQPLSGSGKDILVAKALIFIFVILVVSVIGWGARIIFINRIFSWGEKALIKLPIMGKIYNAIKQISSAFLGHGKTIFKKVVAVEYPRKGLYSIGFTTGQVKGEIKERIGEKGINVFVPTTPNPTSGIFLIVPDEEIHFLDMSVEEGMKLVVSGGSVTPPRPIDNA